MKSNTKKYQLFSKNGCLSQDAIRRYLSGNLSDYEKTLLDEHVLECPLCADAIEGAGIISSEEYSNDINEISNRVSQKTNEKNIISIKRRKKFSRLSYISAAASIVIILSVFFYVDSISNKSQLAVADKKELNDTVFHEEKNLSPQIKDEITITRQKKEKSAFKNKHETETNKKIELPKTNKKIAKKLTVVDNAAEKEDKIIIDDVVVGDESEVIADIDKVEKEETKDVEEKLQTKAYATATKSTIVSGAPASSQKNKNKLGSFSDRSKVQSAEADEVIVKLEEEGVTSDVFYVVDEMPKFKGKGLDEFRKYIQKKLIYPQSAAENGITGRVYISFVVSKKGKIKDVKVVRSVSSVLDKEAIRVVKSSPLWTPGKQSGKNIKVAYTVPIEFKLQ